MPDEWQGWRERASRAEDEGGAGTMAEREGTVYQHERAIRVEGSEFIRKALESH